MKHISRSFDERIANEPKVSLRDGRYVVFDGQNVIAARVDKNSGEELPILCKVYSGLEVGMRSVGYRRPLCHGQESLAHRKQPACYPD